MSQRTERDALGEIVLPQDCLWGIHTQRALHNFRVSTYRISPLLIVALAQVKKACCLANRACGFLPAEPAEAIVAACDRLIAGEYADRFPVDALQGGAGTSTNMNMNEVIANLGLQYMGKSPGDYEFLHPLRHVNMHQSTNDVYPTAVRLAVLTGLRQLETHIISLQGALQAKEKEFAGIVKTGRTQLQPAVPMTLGAEFGAFSEAIGRDRWRVFKSEERIRQVNLGGTAVGTGLAAPRAYIFRVIEFLRELSGFAVARAENTVDQTANSDGFVEVAGMLQAHAASLIKIGNDLRLLNLLGEIRLRAVQAGSSIMPGKVNPVLLECAVQAGMKAASDCGLVVTAASRATLQINEWLPLLSFSLLEAVSILSGADRMVAEHLRTLEADRDICEAFVADNPLIITAFVPRCGYETCEQWLKEYFAREDQQMTMRSFLYEKLGRELVEQTLSPYRIMALGYRNDADNT